jgi:hypothetical protein
MSNYMKNPVARDGADRARNLSDCEAALDSSENILNPSKIQEFRAAWLARRARIPVHLAAALAPLAFGSEAGH